MGTVAATLPAGAQAPPAPSEEPASASEVSSPAPAAPEPAPAPDPAPAPPPTTVPASGPPDYTSSPPGGTAADLAAPRSFLPPPPGQDRVPTHPDLAASLPPAEQEIVERRSRDEKHFRLADGTYEAVFGHNLHYEAAPGRWENVDLNFRPSGPGHVMDRNAVVVRVAQDGISVADGRGQGIRWRTPGRLQVEGRLARFSDQGLDWQYETTATGIKVSAPVAAKRGPQSYEFGYQLIGDTRKDLAMNDRGEIVGQGFIVPPATVTGANGSSYSPGAWKLLPDQRVGFDFDDSALPPEAFPYVIDPTTIFGSSLDDGWGVTGYSPTYPPTTGSTYGHPFGAGNDYLPSGGNNGRVSCASACYATTTGLIRWNTSSLPDNAMVFFARVLGNIGAVDKANDHELMYSWNRWYPVGTEDLVSNPFNNDPEGLHLSGLTPNAYNDIGFRNDNTDGVSKTGYTEMRYLVGNGSAPTGSNGFRYTDAPTFKVHYCVGSTANNAYSDKVLADNPISYWQLDESEPGGACDTRGRNHGRAYGGVTPGQKNAVAGTAMSFNGSTGYINLNGATSLQPTAGLSVEGWVKTTVTTGRREVMRSRYYGYSLHLQDGRPTAFVCGQANPCPELQGSDSVADDRWHHLVLTKDAGTAKFYVDGVEVRSIGHTEPAFYAGAGVAIGRDGDADLYYASGAIDEVAVYGHALAPSRVSAHYAAGPVVTSGATAGGGHNGSTNLGCSVGNHVKPVTSSTGNFWHTFADLSVPGRGPALDLSRTYNSSAMGFDGAFGYGWSSSYTMTAATQASGSVTVTQENGSQVSFWPAAGGGYSAPSWVLATLVKNGDGTLTFTRRAREIFTFSAGGSLIAAKDLNGYVTTVALNAAGRPTSVTDPAGRALTFTYGANGRVATVADPAGRKVAYAYDTDGKLTSVTDVAGGVTTFTYGLFRSLLTMKDPRGGVVTNRYDGSFRVDRQTDALGRVTTFDYTSAPGSTKVTSPGGRVTLDTYKQGQLVSQTRGYGTAQAATTKRAYDPATLGCTSVTDPNNHTTTMAYDARGNRTRVTDPLQRTTTFTYDALNNVTSATDPKGVTTTLTYDARGNLTRRSTPVATGQNQVTTLAYGDAARPGDVTSLTDPGGKVWPLAYDGAGNLTRAADPLGNATTYSYDGIGRRTSTVSPRGNVTGATPASFTTTYAYNPFGDLTATTDAVGASTTAAYDANRNRTSVTDPKGQTTTYAYDAADQLTSVKRPDATSLAYAYDADGNLTRQTDAAGKATTYAYDPLSRVVSMTDPLVRATSFGYDTAGNRTSLKDPAGWTTTFSYDAADQATSIIYSDWRTPNVSFAYDANGQRTSMTDGTGTSRYAYDALGRLTTLTNGAGQSVGYGYDLRGNVTRLTYPNAKVVNKAYDAAGRLASVTDWLGKTTNFNYDPEGNPTNTAYPNAITASSSYDAAGRLSAMTDTKGSTTLASFSYTRDPAGLLKSSTGPSQPTENYAYSALDQLRSVNAATYAYDAADNLTRLASGATLAYDPANEVTSRTENSTTVPYAYDAQGNRTRAGPTGAAMAYSYDRANRLIEATPTVTKGRLVAGGGEHSLAVRADGTLWAWGANAQGQLGNGTVTASHTPVQARGLDQVVAVAAGSSHSLAVRADGTLWAWGANSSGQLGDGTTTASSTPVQVPGMGGVVAVSAGAQHSLAVKADGSVWAWGANASGQLGNGTATASSTPVQVRGLSGVSDVAAGDAHSMAMTWAGAVSTWGRGTEGQLGNAASANSLTPVSPATLLSVKAIAAGAFHSLAVRYDGAVLAWGANAEGQLGNATTADSSVPVSAVGVVGAVGVGGGEGHSLAVLSDGAAKSWGANSSGQLGDGTTTSRTTPVNVASLGAATAITAGANHSLAPTSDARVWAWGRNNAGQLGNGSTFNSSWPRMAAMGPVRASGPTTYAYDGDGLRAKKSSSGTTSAFAWDLAQGLPLLLAEGSTSYIYGPQGLPLAQIDGSGKALYYHHDQLGSTRLLTDAAGNVVTTYAYDAYGRPTTTNASVANPFGFAGEYTDAETGFVYLRARYYDPATAQFITRDPIASITQEPYSYASNNPINVTDPTGMCPWCIAIGVGILVGGGIDLGSQMFDNAREDCGLLDDINWGSVAVWGGVGGVTGGLGHLAKAARAAGALEAPTGIAGYAVSRNGVRHGLHQAIGRDGGRGVSPRAILDAVRGSQPVWQSANSTWKFVGDDAVVILNQRGQVVTTWARSSRGWRGVP